MATSPPPTKRQKRQDYLAAAKAKPTAELPKKKFYRQRAHANPFSDHDLTYPPHPDLMDWGEHFPAYLVSDDLAEQHQDQELEEGKARCSVLMNKERKRLSKRVTVADVGCGFGGLLVALSTILPDELILGLEIRTQVHDFTSSRIAALRTQHLPLTSSSSSPPLLSAETDTDAAANAAAASSTSFTPPQTTQQQPPPKAGPYQNISCLRTNTMKFLPNFFSRAQLSHLFLCFPDPHFKSRKHKARIVSSTLIAEYAYVMRPGGLVYAITDVEDLFEWIRGCFSGKGEYGATGVEGKGGGMEGGMRSELWEGVDMKGGEAGLDRRIMAAVEGETEEGRKVERNKGEKFVGVWRRKPDPEWI